MLTTARKFSLVLVLWLTSIAFSETNIPLSVTSGVANTKFSIDGRIFLGLFASEPDGSYPNRTFDIPDAKLRFVIQPAKNVILVNRMSFSKTAAGGLDYCYLDLKDYLGWLPGHTFRIGRIKTDFGWEPYTDSPIDAITITNSASNITGVDEGVMFLGRMSQLPLSYSLAVTNASKDVTGSSNGLAVTGKVSAFPTKQLTFAMSGYQTGNLVRDTASVECDLKFANLQKAPTGASSWQRSIWQVELLWNYDQSGKSIVAANPEIPPYAITCAYGNLNDACQSVSDRKASYYYVEGLYRITKAAYLATRFSEVELDDNGVEKLAGSPVVVNGYQRLSIACGYRIAEGVIVKVEGTQNTTDGGTKNPNINQLALGFALKF
ncbi:MAG: OprO/OprP family phosphate-selective porin [bacterium]|nr:OprO/OprP family phosphate-selective porin [bacterium]